MKYPSLSVIIPVYNEERTIGSVVDIVCAWEKASEIIVVNDGSTDKTAAAIRQFSRRIRLISYKRNVGKAHAMVAGIRAAHGNYILFLDADLIGLTRRHLDQLILPVIKENADMTIGIRDAHKKGRKLFTSLGGDRAIKRSILLPLLNDMKHLRYGVELFLNNFFKHQRVRYVNMHHVSNPVKFEKQSIQEGTVEYIKEAFDLVNQIARQQAGRVPPRVSKLYRSIAEYLKIALDYFQ